MVMYVTARDKFYPAFPRVSTASDKHWDENAWIQGYITIVVDTAMDTSVVEFILGSCGCCFTHKLTLCSQVLLSTPFLIHWWVVCYCDCIILVAG